MVSLESFEEEPNESLLIHYSDAETVLSNCQEFQEITQTSGAHGTSRNRANNARSETEETFNAAKSTSCEIDEIYNTLEETHNKTEEIAKELLAVVCKNGGMMDARKAPSSLSEAGVKYIEDHGFYPLLQSSLGDVLKLVVKQNHGSHKAILRVKVSIELCKAYASDECNANQCPKLHICPLFLQENCSAEENCNLSHHFKIGDEILKKFKLDSVPEDSLLPLLRSVVLGLSEGILHDVEVCTNYNYSVQGCLDGSSCLNSHLCAHFTKGECDKGGTCTKNHDVLEEKCRLNENFEILVAKVIAKRCINFQNILLLAQTAALTQASSPSVDEICGFHLKGNCRYGRFCKKYWNKLPYLWQIKVTMADASEKWINFQSVHNQIIEFDYCDVNKDTSVEINVDGAVAKLRIDLNKMAAVTETGNSNVSIRRISTPSWINVAPGDTFGTRWTWYWINDQQQWVPYDIADLPSSWQPSNNETLEEHFTSGAEFITLPINGQIFNIDLKNLQQTNAMTGRTRKIRRRPSKFIGEQNIATALLRSGKRHETAPVSAQATLPTVPSIPLPEEWSTMTADQEVLMVTLQPGSAEYIHVQREFAKTLNGRTIHKIERVQNRDLWESYYRKLSKLSKKLRRPVEVRELFHGTDENAVKAICQQGFDWRMSGAHGTACGKGSYFAVAASYSDGYAKTTRSGNKMMFFNKVIVGLYVVGGPNTIRPPAINPSKPYELYHSCVNNQSNPSMFVVFENDQSYPQFLISYS